MAEFSRISILKSQFLFICSFFFFKWLWTSVNMDLGNYISNRNWGNSNVSESSSGPTNGSVMVDHITLERERPLWHQKAFFWKTPEETPIVGHWLKNREADSMASEDYDKMKQSELISLFSQIPWRQSYFSGWPVFFSDSSLCMLFRTLASYKCFLRVVLGVPGCSTWAYK